jgi:hypothetical protein
MAILGNIIIENIGQINIRPTEVIGDVIVEGDYLQLRTYAAGDLTRERSSKQNIQFTKEKAIEFREILNRFIEG